MAVERAELLEVRKNAEVARKSEELKSALLALTIDDDRRRVLRADDDIRLTPKEFELLALLARSADRVLTHRSILRAIWGPNAVDQPEHLWVLMAQLRKKIEPDPSHPKYLLSEPWVGYRFSTEPAGE